MTGSSTPGRPRGYSYVLVTAQFALLAAIGLTGPLIPTHFLFLTLEAAGIGLGIWAVLVMRLGRFNIRPEPAADASLVRKGPYRWLRHPMYTSVLLISAALVGGSFTPVRLVLWGTLCGVLIAKLVYEEHLLTERFPQYRQYKEGTWRLIPYVW
jgi:protein-S-isoprenylcysteine O-methyltransferase Ste14